MAQRLIDKKHKALVDLFLAQSVRLGLTNAALITAVGLVIWRAFPAQLVIGWMFVGYLISLPRHYYYLIIKKTLPEDKVYYWIEYMLVFIFFVSGLFWGITAWMFLIPEDITIFVFVILAVSGVVSTSLPGFSALPYIWVIFAATVLTLSAIKLYFLGFWEIAGLAILNLVGLTPVCFYLNKQIEKSITLDFKNTELLEEVHKAKEKAEQANLAKSQFMAATSHDLRQPLHAQGILLEALSLRLHGSAHSDLLEKTIQSNNVLSSLFNALLEISQLDAGTMPVNISHQPLFEICQLVVDEYHIIAQQKNLSIELLGDDCVVFTDPILLNRILRNLVSNAVKFTETGSIRINIESNGKNIFINVADTGIGIPKSQQQHIFNEYFQLDNKARDRTKGIGLGLGLALVRRMCRLLQHDIQLKSDPGQGTCFRLMLPRGETSKIITKQEEVASQAIENLNIMLIDDEESILDAMSVMLQDWSCFSQAFTSLKEAEDYLEINDYKPDIIISDYRLKDDVTGLDAIRRLHTIAGEKIPALIISGDTDPDLLESINQQDFYMLHKPLKTAQLKKVIRVLLQEHKS